MSATEITQTVTTTSSTAIEPQNSVTEKSPEYVDDSLEEGIPDRGFQAWLVVLGSFCANVTTNGFTNSTGTIQEYMMSHQLSHYSESSVGWVFSLFIFLMYFGSIKTGPLVDAYGLKPILYPGCILWCCSLFVLGSCNEYYQFILGFSILGGLSTSLIMNPSFTVINHWFSTKRAIALAIVAAGGSLSGCFLPIVLSILFEKIGYGWTIRAVAFATVVLSLVASVTMKSRNSKRKVHWRDITIDVKSLKEPKFAFRCIGLLLVEWAYFLPSLFLVNYAKAGGYSDQKSNLLLVYQNIGSTVGRVIGGYAAHLAGTYNCMVIATMATALCALCVWIPAGFNYSALVAFAVLFGFCSGSCISIAPVTVASVSSVSNYGKRYGTAYAIVSLGVLTSLPIGGALTGNQFLSMKLATGIANIASGIAFFIARYLAVGLQWYF